MIDDPNDVCLLNAMGVDGQNPDHRNVRKAKEASLLALILLLISAGTFFSADNVEGHVFQDFDELSVTSEGEIPSSGGGWKYISGRTNTGEGIKSCGWRNFNQYQNNREIFDYFYFFRNTYNNSHMGFETYGFMEIEGTVAVKGNSLRIAVTGGRNSQGAVGKPIFHKEDYLDLLKRGGAQEKRGTKVGHPYVYFCNSSSSQKPIPFPYASGCNRLSLYVRMPKTMTNGPGGNGNPPGSTIHVGPYNGAGDHWYHQYYNQGGGWTHLLVDGHPQHNNAWHNQASYPFPSWSLRDMDIAYFSTMFRWYITFLPYSGIAVPPYNVWLDEIEFYHDSEPQNNETINSPAVTFHSDSRLFEIGFNDKYKNNGDSRSCYEVRYSFSPITNQNFATARPVLIQSDSRFGIAENSHGVFNKWWPYYQAVWAPFRLKPGDEEKLKPGMRIFFAIKDLSNRPYHLGTFDKEGDTAMVVGMPGKRRVDLIKRIDFLIDKNPLAPDGSVRKGPKTIKDLKIEYSN